MRKRTEGGRVYHARARGRTDDSPDDWPVPKQIAHNRDLHTEDNRPSFRQIADLTIEALELEQALRRAGHHQRADEIMARLRYVEPH